MAILLALVCFQLLLAAGAPLGHFAWGGARRVLNPPLRVGSVLSAVVYAVVAVIILEASGVIDVIGATDVVRIAIWFVVVLFGLGVAMNAISRSPGERTVMTPVALVLAVLCAVVAVGAAR